MENHDINKNINSKLDDLEKENCSLREQLVNLELQIEKNLELKDEHLKALNVIEYSVDNKLLPVYYMGAVDNITGYSQKDLLSGLIRWEQIIHPEDLSDFNNIRQLLLDSQHAQTFEYRIISGEGIIRWLKDMAVPVFDDCRQLIYIEGLIIDQTQQKHTEEKLLERQANLDSILNSVQDVIWSVSADNFEMQYISPSAEKVYGYSPAQLYADNGHNLLKTSHEMIMDNFSTLLHQGWFEAEFSVRHPNGQKLWLHRRAHFAYDAYGCIARIDGIDTDITRRKHAEDSLRYISMHDFLTGLYNRFYFEKEMLAIDNNLEDSVGLIVCDVDGLKLINDNLGHEAGDQLLRDCAKVLKTCFHQDEVVSRIGGDEFTIIIKDCSMEKLESSLERLRQTIAKHNESNPPYPLSISIGHALKLTPEVQMREVFREADNLMYIEKPEKRQSFKKLYRSLKI
ncbi:MAG: diguanylate cyclase [Syntrophomonadaceae bacterium]|nr:diguanylate cyclase [Syntrophomonadaceae bacterium]MDD3024209.1 diguanylate cyclase [Syntrophomonadaceae bacterium]